MRQMLMMILHCLYIHISIQKEIYITHVSKKNLNYLKESVVWNQYSNKDRLRTRSGVQFQKWFIVYMQKSVPWSLKSPSASCSHELPLGLFSMLSFWFFFFFGLFSSLLFTEFSFPLTRFLAIDTNSVVDVAVYVK